MLISGRAFACPEVACGAIRDGLDASFSCDPVASVFAPLSIAIREKISGTSLPGSSYLGTSSTCISCLPFAWSSSLIAVCSADISGRVDASSSSFIFSFRLRLDRRCRNAKYTASTRITNPPTPPTTPPMIPASFFLLAFGDFEAVGGIVADGDIGAGAGGGSVVGGRSSYRQFI